LRHRWSGGAVTLAAAVGLLVLAQASALHPQQRGKVYRIGAFHVGDHIPPVREDARPSWRKPHRVVFFSVSPGKHVELFKEMVPGLQRLLVLVDPRDPATMSQLTEIRKAAEILKVKLTEREATHQGDLEQVFRSIKHTNSEGVIPASNTLHIRFTAVLIRLALDKRLPFAGDRKDAVEQGALVSYAPDDAAVGREAAVVVDKILRGARPSDIPVEEPRKFELAVNRKTARLLDLAIPPSILLRADWVVA
jgi:putative ABC transport system substrate-binding protein